MGILNRRKDIATLAAGDPTDTTQRRPGAAYQKMRVTFFNGHRMPATGAPIALGVIASSIRRTHRIRARGMFQEVVMRDTYTRPGEGMAFRVAKTSFHGVAWRSPELRGLIIITNELWVRGGANSEGRVADGTGGGWMSEHSARAL